MEINIEGPVSKRLLLPDIQLLISVVLRQRWPRGIIATSHGRHGQREGTRLAILAVNDERDVRDERGGEDVVDGLVVVMGCERSQVRSSSGQDMNGSSRLGKSS